MGTPYSSLIAIQVSTRFVWKYNAYNLDVWSSLCTHFRRGVQSHIQISSHSEEFLLNYSLYESIWDLWASRDLDCMGSAVRSHAMFFFFQFFFLCFKKCPHLLRFAWENAATLFLSWRPRNVLRSSKLHTTFHRHRGESMMTESLLVTGELLL